MKLKITLIIFLFTFFAKAQKTWIHGSLFTNAAYYVNDKKTGDFGREDRFRSNNYLNVKAGMGLFSVGIQIEGYVPESLLNFSPNLDKDIDLATYFLNYKSKQIDLTLGYFYEQFGSGMILRFWEDKQLGIDNSIRGINIKYTPFNELRIVGLYGKQRAGFDISSGKILGLNAELDLGKVLKLNKSVLGLGLSYVSRSQETNEIISELEERTDAFSGRMNFSGKGWYSKLEYIHKSADALVELGTVNENSLNDGSSLLLNMGFSKRGFGFDTNFRRLENMSFYADREASGNIYNEKLINYLPALTNQYDYSLANIYIYQTQYTLSFNPLPKAGEIGNQFTLYYSIKRKTSLGGKYGAKLALNVSNWYGLKADFREQDRSYTSRYFDFGTRYYSDINIEIRKKWSKHWSGIFNLINLYYNKRQIEETAGEVNASIATADLTFNYSPAKSLRFEGQHLRTKDDKKNWVGTTFEWNLSSKYSLFGTDMYNYGNNQEKIHYFNFGGSYTKNGTRLTLNYGRQRGGLLCVGGVCRVVPETTGFAMTFNTTF